MWRSGRICFEIGCPATASKAALYISPASHEGRPRPLCLLTFDEGNSCRIARRVKFRSLQNTNTLQGLFHAGAECCQSSEN